MSCVFTKPRDTCLTVCAARACPPQGTRPSVLQAACVNLSCPSVALSISRSLPLPVSRPGDSAYGEPDRPEPDRVRDRDFVAVRYVIRIDDPSLSPPSPQSAAALGVTDGGRRQLGRWREGGCRDDAAMVLGRLGVPEPAGRSGHGRTDPLRRFLHPKTVLWFIPHRDAAHLGEFPSCAQVQKWSGAVLASQSGTSVCSTAEHTNCILLCNIFLISVSEWFAVSCPL